MPIDHSKNALSYSELPPLYLKAPPKNHWLGKILCLLSEPTAFNDWLLLFVHGDELEKKQLFLALVLLVKIIKKESDTRSNWQHLEHQSDTVNSLENYILPRFYFLSSNPKL